MAMPDFQRYVTLIWSKMFLELGKLLILIISPLQITGVITYKEKPQMKRNRSIKKYKHGYLIHTWSDKVFEDTTVNRAFSSLQRGCSLIITLIVILSRLRPCMYIAWGIENSKNEDIDKSLILLISLNEDKLWLIVSHTFCPFIYHHLVTISQHCHSINR